MNISSAVQQLLDLNPAGFIFLARGREASGKSTLARAIAEVAHANAIGFSAVLCEYIQAQRSAEKPVYSAQMLDCVERKMSLRQKDIRFVFLRDALRYALQQKQGSRILVVEGWLRQPDQCECTPQILADIFPHHALICAEAECSSEIAFKRATEERGLDTDAPQIIRRCHAEYDALAPRIMSLCTVFAHTLQISSEGSKSDTLHHLGVALGNLAVSLEKQNIKTPARLFGWEEEAQAAA